MEILTDVSLKPYNTFGIDVKAARMVHIRTVEDLQAALEHPELSGMPRLVLGGGSNVLLTGDFEGVVWCIDLLGKRLVEEDNRQVVVEAGAGENWHQLVLHTLDQGWGGIENLSLIPGKVGAAPIQNIGAYGVELKDVFEYVRFWDLEAGEVREFSAAECQFGYRDSVFKRDLKGKVVILGVGLRLRKTDHILHTSYGAIQEELTEAGATNPDIRAVSDAVIRIRQSKLPDPAEIGNGGSFFKNPELPRSQYEALQKRFPEVPGYVVSPEITKVPAAWLIDQAGWKGKRFGNFGVHDRQALVLVNYGGASGQDLYDLSERILVSVRERFGVDLEREVNVI